MSSKFPRISHLPFSPGATSDDKMLKTVDHLLGIPVIISEKADGSNLTLCRHNIYARSHNGPPTHPSFDLAKQIHAQVRNQIPANLSVFGEYLFAVHSIYYDKLPGYFLVFGVREDDTGKWWSWEMVEEMSADLGLPTVPVLYKGVFSTAESLENMTRLLAQGESTLGKDREGCVVRLVGEFTDFSKSLGKFVRKGHVNTNAAHWSKGMFKQNKVVTKC